MYNNRLLRLNFTKIIIVIIALFLIDLSVKLYEDKLAEEPAQVRLLTHEADSIQALRRLVKKSDGFKIVFVGDSIVFGPTGSQRETIPFYLQQELRKKYPDKNIQVFNYGYKGYGISETFLMLNTVRDLKVDMVVFGVNFNWFNRDKVVEYTNALKVDPTVFDKPKLQELGIKIDNSRDNSWNIRLSNLLSDNWALYRNRSNIAAYLLNKSLIEKLYDYKSGIYEPKTAAEQKKYWQDIKLPWYEKNFENSFATNGKIWWINTGENNVQVKFYRLIMDMLNQNHNRIFFYATPVNYEMLDHYKKIDHVRFEQSLNKLRNISRPEDTNFTDLTSSIPGKYFADSVHMMPAGNKLTAQKLVAEIAKKGLI